MLRFFRSAALLGAMALSASALSGCTKSQASAVTARRPANVLASTKTTAAPARGQFADQWDQLLKEKPKPSLVAAPTVLPDPQTMSKKAQIEYIAHSPIFQHRVDGRSFDAAIQSVNDITTELPADVAKGFQQAARFLMVTNLPIEKARQDKRELTDEEIHASVLQAVAGKTPWEILVAAKQKREQLMLETADDQSAAARVRSQ